jgi:hypothetical protein
MTMNTHVARSVRRTLVQLVMVVGAISVMEDWLHAEPELPPATVDRVEVGLANGTRYWITDPARVAGIVRIVRALPGEVTYAGRELCIWGPASLAFYEGTQARGTIAWGGRTLALSARGETATVHLPDPETAELHGLLGLPAPGAR